MDRETVRREMQVIRYGQSVRFRIVKYVILISLFAGLYAWKGIGITLTVLAVLLVVATGVHFFYRWKTNAWRSPWGGFTPLQDDFTE